MSPLAPQTSDTIIEITPEALERLVSLRDEEPEKERLGLRLEVIANPGEEFKYDLSFEIVTKAAFSDEVRTVEGLKIIVPQGSKEHIQGSVLDFSERQGLIIRNPNKPPALVVADGQTQPDMLIALCERGNLPMFATPESAAFVIDVLRA